MDEERAAATAEADRLMEQQLGRMRGMLYNYYAQFYRFILVSIIVMLALIVVSLAGVERAILFAPFYLLYVGFHASYLFSYVIFARTYATAIEKLLNRRLGGAYLVAHELEAAYIFPLSTPRFVAFNLTSPTSFLSAQTAHSTILGGALYLVVSIWAIRVAFDAGGFWGLLYTAWLLIWSAANLLYLLWYYFMSDYEARTRAILEERYGVTFTDDNGNPL